MVYSIFSSLSWTRQRKKKLRHHDLFTSVAIAFGLHKQPWPIRRDNISHLLDAVPDLFFLSVQDKELKIKLNHVML